MPPRDDIARQALLWQALQPDRQGVPADLAALLRPLPGPAGQAGLSQALAAGRRNTRAIAARALAASHPVLTEALGEDSAATLAWRLWCEAPPERGDLADWGEALPALIERLPDLAEHAWLADLARLEWALHRAALAADAPAAASGLQALLDTPPERLALQLRPGTAVGVAAGPVCRWWQAHQHGAASPAREAGLADVAAALARGEGEAWQVWREGLRLRVATLSPADAAFCAALLAGQSLAQALRHAAPTNFEAWLTRALREGWLLAVQTLDPVESP